MSKQQELANQQPDGQDPIKSEYLFKTKPIPGTPFHILNRDNTYTLTMGNHLLTKQFNTEEELTQYIDDNQWNITTTLIIALMKQFPNGIINQNL